MANLFDTAYDCIMASHPLEKVRASQEAAQLWQNNQLSTTTSSTSVSILTPGQPVHLQLVSPKHLPRRKLSTLEGRAALLHALAHIEFNAINLAWDAVYRFRDLPKDFYTDWIIVAEEESRHFELLQTQLQHLGYDYGDFPAHNGLWEMAVDTAHDPLVRMALVPRVLEARGLDATPPIIAKLEQQDLQVIVDILHVILHDEIGHVAAGTRWFNYLCEIQQLAPQTTFPELIHKYFKGRLKGQFNVEARLAAGFTQEELAYLKAEFG